MAGCKTCLDNDYTPDQRREILNRELEKAKLRVKVRKYHDQICWYIGTLNPKQRDEFEKELHSAMGSLLRDRTIPKIIQKRAWEFKVGDRFCNDAGEHTCTITKVWRDYVQIGSRDMYPETEQVFFNIEYVNGGERQLEVSDCFIHPVLNDESE